jgi:hypothetical protein
MDSKKQQLIVDGVTYQKTLRWGNRMLRVVQPSKKQYKRHAKHKKQES